MAWGMKNIIICLFGSSIMEGRIGVRDPNDRWYNVFQRLLSKAHPDTCFAIINSAVGGESTREVMHRFDRDILPYSPDFCLFMAGGNNHDCLKPHRILTDGEIQRILENFAMRLPVKTKPVGIILNPVVDEWHFATRHPGFQDYLNAFNGSLEASLNPEREIARAFFGQHGWPYLDLHTLMSAEPQKYVLPEDGIHLNMTGHALFAQEMFRLLDGQLSGSRGA